MLKSESLHLSAFQQPAIFLAIHHDCKNEMKTFVERYLSHLPAATSLSRAPSICCPRPARHRASLPIKRRAERWPAQSVAEAGQ